LAVGREDLWNKYDDDDDDDERSLIPGGVNRFSVASLPALGCTFTSI
jgi:hypothetical protein